MLVLFRRSPSISSRKQNAEIFLALPFTSLDIGLQKVGASIKDMLWKAAAVFLVFGSDRSVPPEAAIHEGPAHDQAGGQTGVQGIRRKSRRSRARSGACSAIWRAAA